MKAGDKRGRFQQSLRGKPILHVVSNFGEREDIEDNACARTKLGRYAIYGAPLLSRVLRVSRMRVCITHAVFFRRN